VKRLGAERNYHTILVILVLSVMSPSMARGSSSMCTSDASALETAAGNYETATFRFKRAKANLEFYCGLSGTSREDEFACGQLGYAREEYRHAAVLLDIAKNDYKSASRSVASSCNMTGEEQSKHRMQGERSSEGDTPTPQ
jgi:hypothetical protein